MIKKELLIFLILFFLIICLHTAVNKVQALTGSWSSHIIWSGKGGPDGGDIWDFNDDGYSDTVVPFENGSKIVIFISPSNPELEYWTSYVIGTPSVPEDVEVGDINGDGAVDIIAGMEEMGDGITLFLNPGDPLQTPWGKKTIAFGHGFNTVKIADMDGVNGPDIVATSKLDNALIWFQNPGDVYCRWDSYIIDDSNAMDGAHGILVKDIDNDGDLDFYAGGRNSGQIKWYENTGNPTNPTSWIHHFIDSSGRCRGFMWSSFADIDKDGFEDVAVSCAFAYRVVWYKRPADLENAPSWDEIKIASQGTPTGIAVMDVDKDANVDVVSGEEGGGRIHWYELNSGIWDHTVIFESVGGKIDEISPFDFDKDESVDIFFQDQKGSPDRVLWIENPYPFITQGETFFIPLVLR